MNEEMSEFTFVVESMTVEAGRIIPSPALAEAVIGGIAQIIAERDALRADATLWRDHVGQRQAVHDTWAIIEGEAKTFFGDVAALRSENAALKAKWESVPFTSILWARGAILSLLILEDIGMTRGAPVEVPRRILIKAEEILAEWLSDNDPRYSDGLRDNDPKGMKDD